jgi:hypothetical protein
MRFIPFAVSLVSRRDDSLATLPRPSQRHPSWKACLKGKKTCVSICSVNQDLIWHFLEFLKSRPSTTQFVCLSLDFSSQNLDSDVAIILTAHLCITCELSVTLRKSVRVFFDWSPTLPKLDATRMVQSGPLVQVAELSAGARPSRADPGLRRQTGGRSGRR